MVKFFGLGVKRSLKNCFAAVYCWRTLQCLPSCLSSKSQNKHSKIDSSEKTAVKKASNHSNVDVFAQDLLQLFCFRFYFRPILMDWTKELNRKRFPHQSTTKLLITTVIWRCLPDNFFCKVWFSKVFPGTNSKLTFFCA